MSDKIGEIIGYGILLYFILAIFWNICNNDMQKKFDNIWIDVNKLEDTITNLSNSLEDLNSTDWKYVIPEILKDFKDLENKFYEFKDNLYDLTPDYSY